MVKIAKMVNHTAANRTEQKPIPNTFSVQGLSSKKIKTIKTLAKDGRLHVIKFWGFPLQNTSFFSFGERGIPVDMHLLVCVVQRGNPWLLDLSTAWSVAACRQVHYRGTSPMRKRPPP